MKVARLVSLIPIVVLVVGLVMASVASAAPEFKPTGSTVTGATTGTVVSKANGETLTCAKSVASGGVVTSITLIGGITLHLLECTAKTAAGATCPVMSPGAPAENLILTTTLHAVLGLILPKPASGSDVALVVLPTGGSRWYTLLGTCIEESAVSGNIAALVNPVGTATTKGTLAFNVAGGSQEIKDVDLSTGGLVAPKLTSFSATETQELTYALTFGTATEVT